MLGTRRSLVTNVVHPPERRRFEFQRLGALNERPETFGESLNVEEARHELHLIKGHFEKPLGELDEHSHSRVEFESSATRSIRRKLAKTIVRARGTMQLIHITPKA